MDTRRGLWVAYGAGGVVGAIRKVDEGYLVTLTGSGSPTGTYPSMSIAKDALPAGLGASADWPRFREH